MKPSKKTKTAIRRQDWSVRLFDFIESRRHRPFDWAEVNCCFFGCDAVLVQTGVDPAKPEFRGKFKDRLGALRILKKHGGIIKVIEKKCDLLGFREVPVLTARRGDLVVINLTEDTELGPAQLGVCLGAVAAFAAKDGLTFYPVENCIRAWAVGRRES